MIRSTDQLLQFLATVYVPSRLELSGGSIGQMEITIRQFERWAGRSLSIYDLSEDAVRQFLGWYRQTHAAATVNSKRCQLLALWQCAFDEGYLDRAPRRRKIPRAKLSPQIPEAWTAAEVGRILDAAADESGPIDGLPAGLWFRSLVLCLYDTGERKGTTLAAECGDLGPEWIVFRHTKTRRPRWCALHAETAALCHELAETGPRRRLLWSWPYSREMLDKRFRVILRRAGVRFGRGRGGLFHKLRRSSGSLVEANGGDGSRHLGNTRRVFLQSYYDPRFMRDSSISYLPRPR